jgi:HEAT repeat protein
MGPAAKDALPRLLVLLRDNDGNVSTGARTAMEKIDLEEDIIPKLASIAADANGYGGDNAALLLVHPKLRKQGIPKLVELLKLSDDQALEPKALENILQALGKVKPPSDAAAAVEAIVPLLKHEDEMVQQEARAALKKLDPETAKKNGVK